MKFTKITKNRIAKLRPGEKLSEHGLLYIRNKVSGTFYLDLMKDGTRIRTKIGQEVDGFSLEDAIEKLVKVKYGEVRSADPLFSDVLDKYLANQRVNYDNKEMHIRRYLKPRFGKYKISEITHIYVDSYIQRRQREGAKPATINRELATLSHVFTFAKAEKYKVNKPYIKKLPENNIRTRYLTKDEIDNLLACANDAPRSKNVYLFVFIGIFTGMRAGEILNIKISDIDFVSNTIYIPRAKAGARYQPIPKLVSDYIKQHVEENRLTDYLFTTTHGLQAKCIKNAFRRCCIRAGLGRDVTMHTLRHTAITHLVQSGVDFNTVRQISGHKTLQMMARYAHHSRQLVDDAFDKILPKNFQTISSQPIDTDLK